MAIERYQVNAGDTLRQIARRELGNADQWWILASFNKLDHPFIDTSGATYPGKNVLGIGGTLLLVKNLDDPSVKRATIQDDPDQFTLLLGIDLALAESGDLLADPSTGDWQLASGLDNLLGALRRRLLTRAGLYSYHPEYGSNLEPHIGQAGDSAEATAIRLEIIQSLLNDPRIHAVNRISLVEDAEHVAVDALCEVIGSNTNTSLNLVLKR